MTFEELTTQNEELQAQVAELQARLETPQTLDDEIVATKAAIAKVLNGGQVVQTRNGKVELADLSKLRTRLNDLISQKNAEETQACGGFYGRPMIFEGR